jgi:hypothetical protein
MHFWTLDKTLLKPTEVELTLKQVKKCMCDPQTYIVRGCVFSSTCSRQRTTSLEFLLLLGKTLPLNPNRRKQSLSQILKTEVEDLGYLGLSRMSTKDEDYSSYLAYESVALQVLALLCGFTFTAITLLITLLPNPSSFQSQFTLFFLAFMFYLFQFMLFYGIFYLSYCVKAVPPEAEGRRAVMWLWFLSFSLWGIAIVLMFLLWNLTYLASVSGIMYTLFTILTVMFVWKPALELYRKLRSQK